MAYTLSLDYLNPPDVQLTWEPSVDPGFVSYEVYKDTDPTMATKVLVHTELNVANNFYFDVAPGAGVWYYQVMYTEGGGPTDSNIDYIDLLADGASLVSAAQNGNGKVGIEWRQSTNLDFLTYELLRNASVIYSERDVGVVVYEDTELVVDDYTYSIRYVYGAHRIAQGLAGSDTSRGINVTLVDYVELASEELEGGRIKFTWLRDTDRSFVAYQLYRSATSPVSTSSTLVATITDQSRNFYVDTPPPGRWVYNLFIVYGGP